MLTRPSLTADNKEFADGRTCSLGPPANRVLGGIEKIQNDEPCRRWWRDGPLGMNKSDLRRRIEPTSGWIGAIRPRPREHDLSLVELCRHNRSVGWALSYYNSDLAAQEAHTVCRCYGGGRNCQRICREKGLDDWRITWTT